MSQYHHRHLYGYTHANGACISLSPINAVKFVVMYRGQRGVFYGLHVPMINRLVG